MGMISALTVTLVFLTLMNAIFLYGSFKTFLEIKEMYLLADRTHKALVKILKFKGKRRQ